MLTGKLYAHDPALKRFAEFIATLPALILEFYLVLLGGIFTVFLYVLAGMGIFAACCEFFLPHPAWLQAVALALWGILMLTSRISRIFFWTYLGVGFIWLLTVILLVISFWVVPDHPISDPMLSLLVGTLLLVPPAVVSAFVTQSINRHLTAPAPRRSKAS